MAEIHYNSYEEWMRAQVDRFTALRDIHHPDYVDIGGYDDDGHDDDMSCEERQNEAACKARVDKYKAEKIKDVAIDAQKAAAVASIAASATKLTQS